MNSTATVTFEDKLIHVELECAYWTGLSRLKSKRLGYYRRILHLLAATGSSAERQDGEDRFLFAALCACVKSQNGLTIPLPENGAPDAQILAAWRYFQTDMDTLVRAALLEATRQVWPS